MNINYLLFSLLAFWFSSIEAETVLITGSNRGIGLEFARQYAELGWNVIATTRRPESADQLKTLAAKYDNVTIEQLDVTDLEGIATLANNYQDTAIDVLINNAGMLGEQELQILGSLDMGLFQELMAVNVFAPMKISEAFVKHVAASDQKKIVVISSSSGSISLTKRASRRPYYGISKAAVNMAMKNMSLTLNNKGILVGIYMPGAVNTRMLRRAFGATRTTENDPDFDFGKFIPLSPEESVSQLRQRIAELSIKSSGIFINYEGREIPW